VTRSESGRAPRHGRDSTARGRPSGAKGSKKATSTTGGSRITTPGAGADEHRPTRRTRGVQIAAIAFVVLLLVAMAVGCAKYDGDQAAFCRQLDDVPSFMELAGKVSGGTDDQAAATMRSAADEFRALERVAPRSIRHTVAALGDAAERIESDLGEGSRGDRYVVVANDQGGTLRIPVETSLSQERLSAFYDEMQNHHGTVSAVYTLMSYARNDCGISDHELDLGMFGYGPSEGIGRDVGGSGGLDGSGGLGGIGDPGSFGVPAEPSPDPCRGPGCSGSGSSSGAVPRSGSGVTPDGRGGVQLVPPATTAP